MGIVKDAMIITKNERNIPNYSSEVVMITNQLDQEIIANKILSSGRLHEIIEKLVKLSNLQIRKQQRMMNSMNNYQAKK